MYNIIVVDDEKIIRNGIKSYINSHSKDFRVIADFSDGAEARDYLAEVGSDVVRGVITDIKMVEMSGLELAKWIYENRSEIPIIILSGHKQFEYARQALKFNVLQYLLKPTAPKDLDEALDALKKKLENEEKNEVFSEDSSEDYVLAEAKNFIKEHYMEDISLQDVADKLFFSTAYFSRFFKNKTGENFSDYLLKIRMKKSVELLKKGKRVEDVATLCGYKSASYFSHAFKEYYGYTPKDYIRRF